MEKHLFSRPVPLQDLQISDDFWKREMELVRTEVIPYQWEALNDRVPGAEPSFCMRNYKLAGDLSRSRKMRADAGRKYPADVFTLFPPDMEHTEDRFYGFAFQDSDFSKWIEAAAYSLAQHPDEKLEAVADAAIDIVCAAQQEDGYLDTYYIINDLDKRFTNLRDYHELYCFGHLAEGAVAYWQATGKDKLLKAAERFADCIFAHFGPEEGKCKGYPGHEIAEMALARLYEATGKERYLSLARFFTDMRGTQPFYFDIEHPESAKEKKHGWYQQAHMPVREQKEAVGHAVRAVYLYSGMADLARLTKDNALLDACEALFDNIVEKKMYITGGIGATHVGEAFSFAYDLPNDTAYAETCASIGLVFFARRMLQIRPRAKYADVCERALYNGILSGMAQDGKSFFYVNPLESLPKACHEDERKFHVKPVRQKWFGCACCPPNIARLVSSIGSYAYTESDEVFYIHQYIGAEVNKTFRTAEGELAAKITIESGFPWKGNVRVSVQAERAAELTLAFRIPGWCGNGVCRGKDFQVFVREMADTPADASDGLLPGGTRVRMQDGYLYVTRIWDSPLEFDFPMPVRMMQPNTAIREDIGKAALMRGPLVYCIEEADNGSDLHLAALPAEPQIREEWDETLKCVALQVSAKRMESTREAALYQPYAPAKYREATLRFIPYYAWANRGEGEMQVWTRVD